MSLRAFSVAELLALEPPDWLVEGTIPQLGLTVLYGEPGSGKSFVALDLALCVAAGVDWHGHPVAKGFVVYISAEGGGGIGKRVGAWLDHHGILPTDYEYILANFIVSAVNVHPDADDLQQVLAATLLSPGYQELCAAHLEEDEEPPPFFIVVDTLARCFSGDENQQEDMGNFVKALDTLREAHSATVLVVHHTSKEGSKERGSSALRGACDTMLSVGKAGTLVTLKCDKQKDSEEAADTDFNMVMVEKWQSVVLESVESRVNAELDELRTYRDANPEATYTEMREALGWTQGRLQRRMKKLTGSVSG